MIGEFGLMVIIGTVLHTPSGVSYWPCFVFHNTEPEILRGPVSCEITGFAYF